MREDEILDTSWVKPFIHNIFFGDSKDADSFMAKKMPYMNRTYYKYCYVCEESKRTADTIDHNIDNFENDVPPWVTKKTPPSALSWKMSAHPALPMPLPTPCLPKL